MEEIYTTLDLERLASLDELKSSLLEMLLEFDAFCKKHDLTYYLSGGTLLGAIRHKGFIPWDDDIDVNMPRPDCEKLMRLSGGKIGEFTLVPPNNASLTFAYHWKLYGDDILVSKRVDGKKSGIGNKIYPAFMDIFPIEGLPEDYDTAVAHYAKIKKIKRKARFQSFLPRYRGRNPILKLKYVLAGFYFNYFDTTNYHDEVIKLAKKYAYTESDHVGVMMTDVHGIVERVEKAAYTPVIQMDFEAKPFQCPAGYHTYLEQLYGPNYMDVLPPHKQVSRHSLAPFKRKTFAQIDPSSVPAVALTVEGQDLAAEQAAYRISRGKMEEVYTTLDLERLASDEEVKASHLKMLLEFDVFCKKHDLRYNLSGGALLGAVRHKGFIPWDYHIAVNMPRPDCEKLMRLSGGGIGGFTLVPPNNARKTFAYHWNLYSDDILVSKAAKSGIGTRIRPSAMAIFPIDGLPKTAANSRTHYRAIVRIKRKARQQAFQTRFGGRNPVRKLKYDLAQLRLRFSDVTNYHDAVIKRAKKYPYETSEHVGVMLADGPNIVERIKKSDCEPAIQKEFEGKSLQCPANFHIYLETLYGEGYMADVPPHRQFPEHSVAFFKRKRTTEINPSALLEVESDSSKQSKEDKD